MTESVVTYSNKDETLASELQATGLLGLLQRAVGVQAVSNQMAEVTQAGTAASNAILAAVAELRRHVAGDTNELERLLGQALGRTEQSIHHTLAHLDERADQRLESLIGQAARDLDARVAQLERTLVEQRWLQNTYFSRDHLPTALEVKHYYLQLRTASTTFDFDEIGLSVFSQNTEDGVLLYIFSIIGMTTKRCVEIGCDLSGSTIGIPEGNTINLICNFGFDGLIVDMDPAKTSAIRYFFARALTTKQYHRPGTSEHPADYFSPAIVTSEITVDNVNAVFTAAGFKGEVDLLSIDVDGPDLAIWKAVTDLRPRVVVIEVNNRLPFDSVIVGDYASSSASPDTLEYQQSRSSSLGAMYQFGTERGYVFVGMDATLLNAFFVHRDAWDERLPARSIADYVTHRLNPLLDRSK